MDLMLLISSKLPGKILINSMRHNIWECHWKHTLLSFIHYLFCVTMLIILNASIGSHFSIFHSLLSASTVFTFSP